MALAAAGWRLSVSLVDRGGRVTTREYALVADDTAGDASAVLTAATTILSRLNGVTALVVKSYAVARYSWRARWSFQRRQRLNWSNTLL